MATHAERRFAARAARAARQDGAHTRRARLAWLGGLAALVTAAVVVGILVSSGGSHAASPQTASAKSSASSAIASLLRGIPQSGARLGNARAPITITEFSDLTCPACAYFATSTEPALIRQLVRTGKVRLLTRGLETASSIANGAAYTQSQVAILSAGLQNRAWNYLLLAYREQPQTIGGTSAEDVPYLTTSYLQGIAAQIPGLDLVRWQSGLTNGRLAAAVAADAVAAHRAGVDSTPSLLVSGARATVRMVGAPTLAQIRTAIAQAG